MKYLFRNMYEVEVALRAERIYVMVDYDGTLTPIVKHPGLAKLGSNMKGVLNSLVDLPSCVLAIVSGRSQEEVKRLVGIEGAYYLGNHGFEVCGPALNFIHPKAIGVSKILSHVTEVLGREVGQVKGAFVENKGLTISIHYRMSDPDCIPRIRRTVLDATQTHRQLKVTYGKKVLEVRPRVSWNKGKAAEYLMKLLGPGLPVYVGDDETDEDAFSRLRNGVTVLVSKKRRSSKAEYYVKNTMDVRKFLESLVLILKSQASDPKK